MTDPVEPLVLDLLEWLGSGPRPYSEVIEVWRTSCPRLPVWEEANKLGLVDHRHEPGREATVSVSSAGYAFLRARRSPGASAAPDLQTRLEPASLRSAGSLASSGDPISRST